MGNRFVATLLFLTAATLAPLAAAASGGEAEAGWGWVETVGRWVNLLVLVGGLVYFARGPVGRYFQERREGIQKQIREAVEARKAAEEKLAAIEARMKGLDQELEEIRLEAERQARLERDKISEQAALEAEKIVASARREIEGLSLSVSKDLKAYAARLAVELAERKIRGELTEQTEKRVMESFFSSLASRGGR